MHITITQRSTTETKTPAVCCQCFGSGKQHVMQCSTRSMIRSGKFGPDYRDRVVECPQCEGSGTTPS
jgi:hypothetical protein